MSKKEEADRLFTRTQHLLRAHDGMLADSARNRAFYAALKRCVRAGSTVMDIGSGTGIWAVVAAWLGARRVVAIEREKLLMPIIRTLAKQNGVDNIVEAIEGESRRLKLSERFDVIVSETIGNQGFDEKIVATMMDARRRFLKSRGAMIPQAVSVVAAPARLKRTPARLPVGVPIECGYFESLRSNAPIAIAERIRLELLGEAATLAQVDLREVKKGPDLNSLSARWRISDASGVNCVAVWARAALTEDIEIDTFATTSWSVIVYRLSQLKGPEGELEFKLGLSEKQTYWIATFSSNQGQEVQTHSPVFAYAALKAHIRDTKQAARSRSKTG